MFEVINNCVIIKKILIKIMKEKVLDGGILFVDPEGNTGKFSELDEADQEAVRKNNPEIEFQEPYKFDDFVSAIKDRVNEVNGTKS